MSDESKDWKAIQYKVLEEMYKKAGEVEGGGPYFSDVLEMYTQTKGFGYVGPDAVAPGSFDMIDPAVDTLDVEIDLEKCPCDGKCQHDCLCDGDCPCMEIHDTNLDECGGFWEE